MSELRVKTVVIGDHMVGKTTLIQRVLTGKFQSGLSQTVGATNATIHANGPSGPIAFQIWDTAGQDRFRDLVPAYFRNAECALVVYAINDRGSFENVPGWIASLRNISPNATVCLIANKTDLNESRVVSFDDGERMAANFNAGIYEETSALSGEGIETIFPRLAQIHKCQMELELNSAISLTLQKNEVKKQTCCNR
jgi:small GTP-binding protein